MTRVGGEGVDEIAFDFFFFFLVLVTEQMAMFFLGSGAQRGGEVKVLVRNRLS